MTLTHDPDAPGGIATTSPRGDSGAVSARQRKAEAAIQLLRQGETWDTVAKTLGYPDGDTARAWTERALADGLFTVESQEFLRQVAGAKLEALLNAVYDDALDPEAPDQLPKHAAARATLKDHVELMGYGAPKQYVVNSPTAAQIEALVAAVHAADTVDIEEEDIFEADIVEEEPDAAPAE